MTSVPYSQYISSSDLPVTLRCKAAGNPPPIINWGVTRLSERRNTDIKSKIIESEERIEKKEDVGAYNCTASNHIGVVSAVALLQYTECKWIVWQIWWLPDCESVLRCFGSQAFINDLLPLNPSFNYSYGAQREWLLDKMALFLGSVLLPSISLCPFCSHLRYSLPWKLDSLILLVSAYSSIAHEHWGANKK